MLRLICHDLTQCHKGNFLRWGDACNPGNGHAFVGAIAPQQVYTVVCVDIP